MVYHFMYMDTPIADVTVGENTQLTALVVEKSTFAEHK